MIALLPLVLAAAAWWLLTRPYHGFWHDGIFYAVQALKNLHPERYAHDLFFLYGSQDDFTLYGKLQAWLTGVLGMQRTLLVLAAVGAVLWLTALIGLLARWLSGLPLAAALVLVLAMDSHYAGFGLFSYGESFATPRIFAEALVLFSLSCWLDARRLPALLALAGAAVLHPLIALAGIGVIAWSLLGKLTDRPLVLWTALLALGLLGLQLLVWAGLSPRLDPLWRQLLAQRSPYVFPYLWGLSDWLRVALDAALLWMAARHVPGEAGKLASWVLPVFALGMLYAMAAGVLGVQLAVAAQIHRVQWLAHLLALALAVPLVQQLWQTDIPWERILAAGVASSLFFPSHYGGLLLPCIYLLYLLVTRQMPGAAPSRLVTLLLLGGVPLMALSFVASSIGDILVYRQQPVWLNIFVLAPVALWLLLAGHVLARRLRLEKAWLWGYALGVLALGMSRAGSEPWNGYDQPERVAAIAPAQALIPTGAVVYWEGGQTGTAKWKNWLFRMGVGRTWFWLERAHYASINQAVGGLFYRQTAVEAARRIEHLRKWGFQESNLDWSKRGKPPPMQALTPQRLQGICSDPVLNYVITDTELPGAALGFEDPLSGIRFSVYDCAAARAG
jgi:hypothetical protein